MMFVNVTVQEIDFYVEGNYYPANKSHSFEDEDEAGYFEATNIYFDNTKDSKDISSVLKNEIVEEIEREAYLACMR